MLQQHAATQQRQQQAFKDQCQHWRDSIQALFAQIETWLAPLRELDDIGDPITELRSAVIWTKGLSAFTPDYSVEFLPTNPWIHQPFEGYDSLRPAQLLEKWQL